MTYYILLLPIITACILLLFMQVFFLFIHAMFQAFSVLFEWLADTANDAACDYEMFLRSLKKP